MPRDEDYFSRSGVFLDRVRKELEGVDTVAELKRRALAYGWDGAGTIIAAKVDRLTGHKIKPDGTRDGRWIWQNVKAFMGRRIKDSHPANGRVAMAIRSLIAHEHKYDEFWGLVRDKGGRNNFLKKRKKNDPVRNALDVLTILLELNGE